MNKELLKKVFREYKKAAGLDYAITRPDNLGDCMSCVNYALSEKYGEDSKGVWVKHWITGMNGYGEDVSALDSVYIAHDITEEQAKTFYEVLGKYYNITPAEYNPSKSFNLYEKDTEVYEVSYTDTWSGEPRRYSDTYATKDHAMRRAGSLMDAMTGTPQITDIQIKRLF